MNIRYITDEDGKKLSVILPIEEYERLIDELEEFEDIKFYDEAKAEIEREGSDPVPWEKVREEIGTEYEEYGATHKSQDRARS